jgi:uncharacterized repeat protein (TIGR03803 family)
LEVRIVIRFVVVLAIGIAATGCSHLGAVQALPYATEGSASATPGKLAKFQTIFQFDGQDGAQPVGALTPDSGVFYGVTWLGGAKDDGVLFAVTADGKEMTLHSFANQEAQYEVGSLAADAGVLYGTASGGGKNNYGAIFAYKTNGRQVWSYSFKNGYDGRYPHGGLTLFDHALYGTTAVGGGGNDGTFYRITLKGALKTLYTFEEYDGNYPVGQLVAVGGKFFGVTEDGGPTETGGTVYSMTTSGHEKILHTFPSSQDDGSDPQAGLVELNGVLYGTTERGGKKGYGTVFSITTTGEEHVLHSFMGGSDGQQPVAPLVAFNGKLYGTTQGGGAGGNHGTIFEITPAGKEQVIYVFNGRTDGYDPSAGLIASNGKLYGTTEEANSEPSGSIYALTPP